jgi:hypothetical protein
MLFSGSLNGLVSAVADRDIEIFAPQDFFEAEQDMRIIFDNEDFCFHGA